MAGPQTLTADQAREHYDRALELAERFYSDRNSLGRLTPVSAADMPIEYRSLLAHDDHMTVALEAHYDSMVKVRVVAEQRKGDLYARKSLLSRQSDGVIVQLGIVQIDLGGLPQKVADDILGRVAPLGRILIRNNLLREVELLALWKIDPGDEIREALRLAPGQINYGRSARILVDGHPAIELLEIVRA